MELKKGFMQMKKSSRVAYSNMCENLRDYEKYKKYEYIKEDRYVRMSILDSLKKLHFDLDEIGTHLFAQVIEEIHTNLEDIRGQGDIDTLVTLLEDEYSQFYCTLAREDNDIGIKSFHKLIKETMAKRNAKDEVEPKMEESIEGVVKLALSLARYENNKIGNCRIKKKKSYV